MIWKEKGVEKDSYMCFFNPSETFRNYYFYMYSCGYFHTNADYCFESTERRPHLFFYLLKGELCIEQKGKKYTAHANDMVLLDCHEYSKYYCEGHCEFLFFHFDGSDATRLLKHLVDRNQSPIFTLPNAKDIYLVINEPILRLCYQEQASDTQLSVIVYTTLCMLQEHKEEYIQSATPTEISDSTTRVIKYIKNHIYDTPQLQQLADVAGLSPYYFSRIFKAETGLSPIEYVAVTKINYAKMMLRTTNASVSKIAETLGYSSSSSFINAFKARRGISPNQYRTAAHKVPTAKKQTT